MKNRKVKFTTTLSKETLVDLERIRKELELKHLNDVIEKLVEEKRNVVNQ